MLAFESMLNKSENCLSYLLSFKRCGNVMGGQYGVGHLFNIGGSYDYLRLPSEGFIVLAFMSLLSFDSNCISLAHPSLLGKSLKILGISLFRTLPL